MFSKWFPLIRQLMFGWDTITGLGTFIVLSFVFDVPANLWVLVFAGVCAYLPDFDFIAFLLLRKRLNLTTGHWVFGHYPTIVLPLVVMGTWLTTSVVWPGHVAFLTILATSCTVGHFIHDSTKRGGFHLLAPFTADGRISFTLRDPMIWTHYRIGWQGVRVESREDTASIYTLTETLAQQDGNGEVTGRVEPVTRNQVVSLGVCIAGFGWLLVRNGYQLPF